MYLDFNKPIKQTMEELNVDEGVALDLLIRTKHVFSTEAMDDDPFTILPGRMRTMKRILNDNYVRDTSRHEIIN